MAATIALIFRKDKLDTRNKAPVYLRITKNRKTNYISTNIRLEERYWDKKSNKVKPSYPNSARLNNHLNKLLLEYEDKLLKEQTENTAISVKELKRKISGTNSLSFFEIADVLTNSYKERGNIGTYDCAKSITKKIKDYTKSQSLGFADITPNFLADYEKHLRMNLKNKTNTINRDLRFIRRVFNRAYKLGYIKHEDIPFNRYQLRSEKTHRAFLTEAELTCFYEVEVEKGSKLELTRDIFTFCAYCGGMRISDVLQLRKSHFNGTHINFSIQKTGKQLVIKAPDKAIAIITKYLKERPGKDGFIFPELPPNTDLNDPFQQDAAVARATARINKNLKVLAKKAGIEKPLSSACSRHSFACMALKKGISVDKVSKIMAHSNLRETLVYARLVAEDLDNAMDLFN